MVDSSKLTSVHEEETIEKEVMSDPNNLTISGALRPVRTCPRSRC